VSDARRDVGLFRYALIREAADLSLSKAERGCWSGRWPPGTMSALMAPTFVCRVRRWIGGSGCGWRAGSTRWSRLTVRSERGHQR
jgi:hypothetical protein